MTREPIEVIGGGLAGGLASGAFSEGARQLVRGKAVDA